MAEYDLVVRGGTVADGTGTGTREADVAIKDGKIAAVGTVSGKGAEEIAAKGLLVTPGFVDIHTHYDGQATWDSHLQPSSWHGVTTAVMGNCGVGFAPVKIEDRQRLIELMEGVEDIPGAALDEGLDWSWESFGQYLDALEARPRDMDLGAQLPHGALRVFVMGERAARLEEATPEEVAQMRVLTADAMRAGAIGFSTSRTLNHRTVKGDPTPSLRASEAELMGIVLGMKDAGKGVIEFISDFNTPDPESEFEMIDRLLTASGRPFSVSLAQAHRRPEGWRRLLGLVEGLAAKGHAAKAQVAPRPIGVLQGLQASRTPFSMCASFARMCGWRAALYRGRESASPGERGVGAWGVHDADVRHTLRHDRLGGRGAHGASGRDGQGLLAHKELQQHPRPNGRIHAGLSRRSLVPEGPRPAGTRRRAENGTGRRTHRRAETGPELPGGGRHARAPFLHRRRRQTLHRGLT